MLTRQVLESQRKQTQGVSKAWQIEMSADKLWVWASAWLKRQVALPHPAPSLRYPGWVSGQLEWTGPKPWLELPFCWERGRFFRVEQCAGPRAYLHWEIECQPLSSTRSRLALKCRWQWSRESVFQNQWRLLSAQIDTAVMDLEALQTCFPVGNLAQLEQAGKHVLALFGYVESGLVQHLTGAARTERWQWFQRLIHGQGFESAYLKDLHAGRETLLTTWDKETQAEALRLVLLHPDYSPAFVCEGLHAQRYLWPQQTLSICPQGKEALPWQGPDSSTPYYLAQDILAPRSATQSLQALPEKAYRYVHPEGALQMLNTASFPVVFAYGAHRMPVCDLRELFLEPAATPYLFCHWPENHPVTLNLTLCLVSPGAESALGKGLAAGVQSGLSTGRVLLSSPQALLLAFGNPVAALQWCKHLYAEHPTWIKWGLLPSAIHIALSEGPVQVYPQHAHWRVMGPSVRELNVTVARSEGDVVLSTGLFAQQAVQAFCRRHRWHVYYDAESQWMHLRSPL